MKKLIVISCCIFAFVAPAFGQGDCETQKIVTAAVTKASALTVDLVTCSTIVVKWQGVADQSYFVTAVRRDTITHTSKDTIKASSVSCDFAQQCKSTINVPQGVAVSWMVESSKKINEKVFYSYLATDGKTYTIPKCGEAVTNFPPVASAWFAKFYSPSSVLLAAWGSYDPEGQPIQYLWRKVSGPASYNMLYANSASPVISQLVNGKYEFELLVTDIKGATARDTIEFNITGVNGITVGNNVLQEIIINQATGKLNVFPNPAINELRVSWNSEFTGEAALTIMDFSGKAVLQTVINKQLAVYSNRIDVNGLKQGVYYLFIKMNNGRVVSERFYKN